MVTDPGTSDDDGTQATRDRLVHHAERERYELHRGPEILALLHYEDLTVMDGQTGQQAQVRDLRSTIVSPEHQGAGLGSRLVRFALDDVRQSGRKVTATCWFAEGWISRHEDYADLRHPAAGGGENA